MVDHSDMQVVRIQIDRAELKVQQPRVYAGTVGGSRDYKPAPTLPGLLFRPALDADQPSAVLILPDFFETVDDQRLCTFAAGMAAYGFPALILGLSRLDDGMWQSRFRYDGESTGAEVGSAIKFLAMLGTRRVFIAGHGFGIAEALDYYQQAARDRTVGSAPALDHSAMSSSTAHAVLGGIWRLGSTSLETPDCELLGIPREQLPTALQQAHGLEQLGRPRAYVAGEQWAIEAGTLLDYFDESGPAGCLLRQASEAPIVHIPDLPSDDEASHGPSTAAWIERAVEEIKKHQGGEEALAEDRRSGFRMFDLKADEAEKLDLMTKAGPQALRGEPLPSSLQDLVAIALTPAARASNRRDPGPGPMTSRLVPIGKTGDMLGLLSEPANPDRKSGKGILLNHGYTGHFHDDLLLALSRYLSWHGHTVLALNRRDSGRRAVESTVAQCLDDIHAGLLFLEEQGVDDVFLHGHSIGAYLAIRYAAERGASKLAGIILTGAIADFYRWDADHSRAEERSRAARQLESARKHKDPSRKIIMEWSSTRDEGDSGTSSDRTFLKVNTAESVASFLGQSWPELLGSEQSVASLIDQRLTQPENAAEAIETPLLIIRSAADTHAPRSESLAIFHGAVHAAPTVLLEWDGLSGGSWLEPLRAHSLYPFRNGTSIAIDRWMHNPGWIPPFPDWKEEQAARQEAREKEAAAAPAHEPDDPQLEDVKQAFDEVRRWKTSFEPSDSKRLFTAKFNLLWRGTEEIRQPKPA